MATFTRQHFKKPPSGSGNTGEYKYNKTRAVSNGSDSTMNTVARAQYYKSSRGGAKKGLDPISTGRCCYMIVSPHIRHNLVIHT